MKDKLTKYAFAFISLSIPLLFVAIVVLVMHEAAPAIKEVGWGLFDKSGSWRPLSGEPSYSILPMILGTLCVSFLAVAFAIPIGCACAIFLNYFVDKRLSKLILSFIDLLAGIPSVIFGFVGLLVVVKNLEKLFDMATGECVLAAAFVLGIMLLPFVISAYSESVERAKAKYNNISVSLGVSSEYSILRTIIPVTKRSVAAAAMSAFGRAIGETMAVMMVMGNSPIFPKLFGRGRTIPSLTALEMGSAEYGSMHSSAIYSANLVLLILLGIILAVAYFFSEERIEKNDRL